MDAPDLDTATWMEEGDASAVETLRVRKCRLEVLDGLDSGRVESFAQPTIVIGRSGGDLALTDKKVSALHVEISLEPAGYRLRDLGSTNGTFVWGMRVLDGYIGPGAVISVGDTAVRFEPLAESVEVPLWQGSRYAGIIGASTPMRRLYNEIERIAVTDMTVLITGATGTGKELVAEAVHERSPRAEGPFVVLDCGGIPLELFEDRLFGHEPGAYTGASGASRGVFEAADGGTLFLDEIGELPLAVQAKLLRAVDTRTVRRLGGHRSIECDVRIVAATNRDLPEEVNRKAFRSDLYYRLNVAHVVLPSLRDRREDIPLLVEHFTTDFEPAQSLPDGFMEWASRYGWPGNVRELRNAVERAAVMRTIPENDGGSPNLGDRIEIDLAVPFKDAKQRLVDAFDRRYVIALLEEHDWNVAAAARAARLDRMSVYKMLQRLQIERPD